MKSYLPLEANVVEDGVHRWKNAEGTWGIRTNHHSAKTYAKLNFNDTRCIFMNKIYYVGK
jgi:hypothetical protein